MIRCPKCGHDNSDNAVNCSKCRINLQFALQNLEQLKAQSEAEEQGKSFSEEMEKKMKGVLITTTPIMQGKMISQYLGTVSSSIVLGTGPLSELYASVSDLFGTRSGAFEKKLTRARELVFQDLREQTVKVGGDGIIGLDLDYIVIGQNMIMVSGNGTAVKIGQHTRSEI